MVNPSRLQRQYCNEMFKVKIMRNYSIAGKFPSARACNYRNKSHIVLLVTKFLWYLGPFLHWLI